MEPIQDFEAYWNTLNGPIEKQVTAIVIGAGLRGQNYSTYALDLPSRLKIVGVAEPSFTRRSKMQNLYNIPDEMAVEDWRIFTKFRKVADVAFICTQDQYHKEPAVSFANLGYNLLLEKPMATSIEDCEEITEACINNNVIVNVCLVPRHFPPCVKIKEIIQSGTIGDVVLIQYSENIGWWHFAHSYVRGNWNNESKSTFSFLAKCCHDLDLIRYWMNDIPVTSIQSFGGLKHFKQENKPVGAASNCLDCEVHSSCPYSVQKIYLNNVKGHWPEQWPMSAVCDIEDYPIGSHGYRKKLTKALKNGRYGRCVYECDNDVADHQIVNLVFENDAKASIIMNAFSRDLNREVRICGTAGEIRWNGDEISPIQVTEFTSRKTYDVFAENAPLGIKCRDHEGADFFIVNSLVRAIAANDQSITPIDIDECYKTHLLVFEAERSRKTNSVLNVNI
ncbi:putative oxidoreductase YteT [Lepeophtheirus salmonis]|nr:putative oxidoreductase YteT [Lepeophtheirus salmonis]XP_040568882.1 putative oxidoreductase YteT [Lepeophtheirus salmonis]